MRNIEYEKKIAFVLTAALMFGLVACGAANEPNHTSNSSAQTESSQVVESSSVQDSQDNGENSIENVDNTENAGTGKVLIACFAVAENSDVDAISSASVTEVDGEAKGLVRTIAEDIQAATGGDLFSIETSVDYPGDINDLIEYASGEQDEDVRPELTSHIENLDEYDTIFVGYPLWWGEMPMIVRGFLENYDFDGKTVVPFCAHGGSGLSGTVQTVTELCTGADISDGFAISGETAQNDRETAQENVTQWLKDGGFIPVTATRQGQVGLTLATAHGSDME